MAKRKDFFPASQIGRDPHNRESDADFYAWITGTEPDKALAEFLKWLIEDLKEETDPEQVRRLLADWRERCSPEEFNERMNALEILLPAEHIFHQLKRDRL